MKSSKISSRRYYEGGLTKYILRDHIAGKDRAQRAGSRVVSSVVEHLPMIGKTLSLILSTEKEGSPCCPSPH